MNPMQQIEAIANSLPTEILEDINKRINDRIASGGKGDHWYIEQQLRYAKQFTNLN